MDEPHGWTYLGISSTPLLAAVVLSITLAVRRSGVDVNWGSLGEWAGAIATLAAVVVALWVAIRDSRRREADRKDEQAAQARLVTVDATQDGISGSLSVSVTNHSTSPVFAVVVEAVHVSPDPLRARFQNEREWSRINPGERMSAKGLLFKMDGTTIGMVIEPNRLSAEVSFVDSSGLRWRRWGNTPPRGGAPVKDTEPPRRVPEVPAPEN